MSCVYEPEIPQFEPLAENGENYATWRVRTYSRVERENAKECGDGQGGGNGQGDGHGKGRRRRRGRKPAIRSQNATGTTGDRPSDQEDTYTHDVTTSSIQNAPADAQASPHEPIDASKAIACQDDTQAATYAFNATQESNPDAPADEVTPDNAPAHLEASDAFSSHRIAKLRDLEPTTLDDAGLDPFWVGEGDIRRKSTSRDAGATPDPTSRSKADNATVDRCSNFSRRASTVAWRKQLVLSFKLEYGILKLAIFILYYLKTCARRSPVATRSGSAAQDCVTCLKVTKTTSGKDRRAERIREGVRGGSDSEWGELGRDKGAYIPVQMLYVAFSVVGNVGASARRGGRELEARDHIMRNGEIRENDPHNDAKMSVKGLIIHGFRVLVKHVLFGHFSNLKNRGLHAVYIRYCASGEK
ncbi:hypothetical protein BDV93DRAFT_542195 [Ceratobasidium sp. AG-I]|nr:hypothetical protein BDV93DRAFT_542195 [Ceratobasidium sp. AG-I]